MIISVLHEIIYYTLESDDILTVLHERVVWASPARLCCSTGRTHLTDCLADSIVCIVMSHLYRYRGRYHIQLVNFLIQLDYLLPKIIQLIIPQFSCVDVVLVIAFLQILLHIHICPSENMKKPRLAHVHLTYISRTSHIHLMYISHTYHVHITYISRTSHGHLTYISRTSHGHLTDISLTIREDTNYCCMRVDTSVEIESSSEI